MAEEFVLVLLWCIGRCEEGEMRVAVLGMYVSGWSGQLVWLMDFDVTGKML